MRLPFPERIPVRRAAAFAVALYIVQRLEGTSAYFAAGCFLFILISTIAFNTAGGLTRVSGGYIFFYSTLVVIVGICYKAFLGEPADSHILAPSTDIEIYVAGISGMFIAAYFSRFLSARVGFLQIGISDRQMYFSSIGCIAAGTVAPIVIGLLGSTAIQSAFAQLNELIPLGIITGVMCEIRRSGGRRSTNPFIIGGGAYFFLFYGLAGFSKQGMLVPMFSWLLPVWAMRYRISRPQLGGCLLTVFVIFHYLTPLAQYGRSFLTGTETSGQRISIAFGLIERIDEVRKTYMEQQAAADMEGSYFDSPQGFWERLTFVYVDDTLVDFTNQGHILGLAPIAEAWTNGIPRALWPGKPNQHFGGNYYAREMGRLSEEDTSTGISFSPTAEAYHLAGWYGVLLLAPLLWLALFFVMDALFNDISKSPWGLLAIVDIAHLAPEGGVTGIIHELTFGVEILVFCALFATWVAPLIGSAILGVKPADAEPSDLSSPTAAREHA